jgi:hypothetical protein
MTRLLIARVFVTLDDKKLAQITKLFLLNYKFAGKSAGNSLAGDCGADNDEVINCPASELPADFPANL